MIALLFLFSFQDSDKTVSAELPIPLEGYLLHIRDERTGELRKPTEAEYQAVKNHFKNAVDLPPIEEFQKADGTVIQRLNGHHMLFSLMILTPEGQKIHACLSDPKLVPQNPNGGSNVQ